MKKTMIAGVTAAALAAPAYAELEGDLSLTYQNQYDFRGLSDSFEDILDDSVIAELNASYSLNDQWSLVAGAHINTVEDVIGFDHHSFRAGVMWKSDCCTVELGYQYHQFSATGSTVDTGELYLDFNTKCPLTGGNVNFFWAHDMDDFDGDYVELSLTKGFEVNDMVSVNLTGGVSFAFDYLTDADGFNNVYLKVDAPIKLTDNLTLTPYIKWTNGMHALEDESSKFLGGGGTVDEGDALLLGVSASVKF